MSCFQECWAQSISSSPGLADRDLHWVPVFSHLLLKNSLLLPRAGPHHVVSPSGTQRPMGPLPSTSAQNHQAHHPFSSIQNHHGPSPLFQCSEPPGSIALNHQGPMPFLQHPEPPGSITLFPASRTTRVHCPFFSTQNHQAQHPYSSVQNHQGSLPLLQRPEPRGSITTRVHHAFSSAQNHQGPSPLLQYPEPPVLGAGVRHSAHGKGHEEGGSTYAKAGSSLRSLPGNPRASTPITRACLLYYFALSPTPLTLRGAVPHHLFRRRS